MNAIEYAYRFELIRIVDGDMLEVRFDLGFGIQATEIVRIRDIDAPEERGQTLQEGREATAWVAGWFMRTAKPYIGYTTKRKWKDKKGKYGRYLVRVTGDSSNADLGADMVEEGFAKVYGR